MSGFSFDLDEVKEVGELKSGSPAPEGWNDGKVTHAEVKENSSGTGYVLLCEFENERGEIARANFNIKHEKPTVQNIGRGQFKRLALACGHPGGQVNDPVAAVLGKRTLFKAAHRDHKGNTYADAKDFAPVSKAGEIELAKPTAAAGGQSNAADADPWG